MEQKNYQEYGYKEGTEITMTAEVFQACLEVAEALANAETKVGVEMRGSVQDTFSPTNVSKHFTSIMGLKAFALIENLGAIHEKNVDEGVALHQDILEKPMISVLD